MESFPFDTKNCGPVNIADTKCLTALFLLFWGPFLPLVLDEINAVIVRLLDKGIKITAKPVDEEEFFRWLAAFVHIGLVKLRQIHQHWRIDRRTKRRIDVRAARVGTNNYFYNHSKQFFKIMGRDRFQRIHRTLWHLHRLKKMEVQLNENFKTYWEPYQWVAIDETMRKFKGRSEKKKYIPAKPIRYGLRYYCLVDQKRYLYHFILHRKKKIQPTKSRGRPKKTDPPKEKDSVLLQLMKSIVNHLPSTNGPHIICADSYYTTKQVADYLAKQGLGFFTQCSSIRSRQIWQKAKDKMKKGDAGRVGRVKCGTYVAVLWEDFDKNQNPKLVRIFSNASKDESIKINIKNQKTPRQKIVPYEVSKYMKGMGFVDALNQAIRDADAASNHRNRSWRKCHFLTLIRFTLNNMYIINKHDEESRQKREPFGDFLDRCVDEFIEHADHLAEQKKIKRQANMRKLWRESKRRSRERQAETKSKLNQMTLNFLLN